MAARPGGSSGQPPESGTPDSKELKDRVEDVTEELEKGRQTFEEDPQKEAEAITQTGERKRQTAERMGKEEAQKRMLNMPSMMPASGVPTPTAAAVETSLDSRVTKKIFAQLQQMLTDAGYDVSSHLIGDGLDIKTKGKASTHITISQKGNSLSLVAVSSDGIPLMVESAKTLKKFEMDEKIAKLLQQHPDWNEETARKNVLDKNPNFYKFNISEVNKASDATKILMEMEKGEPKLIPVLSPKVMKLVETNKSSLSTDEYNAFLKYKESRVQDLPEPGPSSSPASPGR